MAYAYVTEYERLAEDAQGKPIMCGMRPAVNMQRIALSAASAQLTTALNSRTRFVHITTDQACSFRCGKGNQTALVTDTRIPADGEHWFGLPAAASDGTYQLAAIANG